MGPAETQPARTTDVILRTDGSEIPGRMLAISPLELRYLPPTGADTLRLTTTEVFLVRCANGTRELLHPLTPSQPQHPATRWRSWTTRSGALWPGKMPPGATPTAPPTGARC